MRKEILIGPAVLLVVWIVIGEFGLISPLFIPAPSAVAVSLWELLSAGDILKDIGATLYRMVVGFACAAALGIPAGLLAGFARKVYFSFEFVIDFCRSIPSPVLVPLAMLFFGLGDPAKIAIVTFTCGLINLVNSMYGVTNCKKTRVMIARTMKATPMQTFVHVVLPDALPQVFVGLRLTLSLALIVVVVTEMFVGTTAGLGRRIYDAHDTYRIAEMYGGILLIGALGYLTNKLFVVFEKRCVHWAGR